MFVEWVGLESEPVSRWTAFDLPGLGVLDEATFAVRSGRVRVGLPPLTSERHVPVGATATYALTDPPCR